MTTRINGVDFGDIIRDVKWVTEEQREQRTTTVHAEGTATILVDVNHPLFDIGRRTWKKHLRRQRMARKRRRGWA